MTDIKTHHELKRLDAERTDWEMAEAQGTCGIRCRSGNGHRLHIQLLLSKWMLTLERHRSELDEIEREMIEYAARLNQPRLPIDQEPVE